jgi:malonyl-CoA O-methyltransferase
MRWRPMSDPAVLRRFSASASRYDAHAYAQRLSAADLLAFTHQPPETGQPAEILRPVREKGPAIGILEPGCGTGLYTQLLLDAFPEASIEAVDLSAAMVRIARERIRDPRVRFSVADAEEIAAGRYDLITSNATFQWFRSFDRTVARMASLLSGGGRLSFSFFGPGTYAELDDALRSTQANSKGDRAAAAGFLSRKEIAASLSAVFPRWDIVERVYLQEFPDLTELLRSIRYTGTGGGGARGAWTPGRLARAERAYRERHGGIRATYQVFLCRGDVPGRGAG